MPGVKGFNDCLVFYNIIVRIRNLGIYISNMYNYRFYVIYYFCVGNKIKYGRNVQI